VDWNLLASLLVHLSADLVMLCVANRLADNLAHLNKKVKVKKLNNSINL
jgi:hypothetical protein